MLHARGPQPHLPYYFCLGPETPLQLLTLTLRLAHAQGWWAHSILSNFDLHIVGLTNPSGKVHLEETGDYCWRNTGIGVDLNRNADWEFGGPGSSNKKGHEESVRVILACLSSGDCFWRLSRELIIPCLCSKVPWAPPIFGARDEVHQTAGGNRRL